MKYTQNLASVADLDTEERLALQPVADAFVFRASQHYLKLINWNDPEDPLRRLIIPHAGEMEEWGALDASNEASNTVAPGVQHKYADTVLLLCSEVCGGYCRYCFRKRLFMAENNEASRTVDEGLAYIAAHPEVTDVLLTGGDPLTLSTQRLIHILDGLAHIPHVKVVRIGSKMLAFDPRRVLDDERLLSRLAEQARYGQRIYLMCHFDHPNELGDDALAAMQGLLQAGVVLANQCPLVRGINDDAVILAELWGRLVQAGCTPYYLFQGRPTAGNAPYRVPLVEGFRIYREALSRGSGLTRRARFVMSHASGKIEVLDIDEHYITLRYHRARDPEMAGRVLRFLRDDSAHWLDDLKPVD